MKIPELLAPAGNMEKAKIAVAYGADALYLSGKQYGMRAEAGNFHIDELEEMVKYVHPRGVKVYVTVNIFPHNRHLTGLPEYLGCLQNIGVDAVIISDPGVYRLVKKAAPNLPLHLSTQANTLNYEAALFWQELGFKRLVLAREVTLEDVRLIAEKTRVELELFVHGSMCMAYSGRCLLSNVLTGRDANLGLCAQSCRWKYALTEEKRPGQYFPIEEDGERSYVFNSRDLCLIEYLPQIIQAGVSSLKIEGRMRSVHYVATVVGAYRKALDELAQEGPGYKVSKQILEELDKVSHRPYYPGFLFGDNHGISLDVSTVRVPYTFCGLVKDYDQYSKKALVEVKNRIKIGDEAEVIQPKRDVVKAEINLMNDYYSGISLEAAHANSTVLISLPEVKPGSLIRIFHG
jgi:putative protease